MSVGIVYMKDGDDQRTLVSEELPSLNSAGNSSFTPFRPQASANVDHHLRSIMEYIQARL